MLEFIIQLYCSDQYNPTSIIINKKKNINFYILDLFTWTINKSLYINNKLYCHKTNALYIFCYKNKVIRTSNKINIFCKNCNKHTWKIHVTSLIV